MVKCQSQRLKGPGSSPAVPIITVWHHVLYVPMVTVFFFFPIYFY